MNELKRHIWVEEEYIRQNQLLEDSDYAASPKENRKSLVFSASPPQSTIKMRRFCYITLALPYLVELLDAVGLFQTSV